jgi:CBS domain-containing protein
MQVREIMNPNVASIHPGAPLTEASRLMQRRRSRVLAVVEDGSLVGVLTERDITVKAMDSEMNPENDIVADSMTLPVVTCSEGADISEVRDLLTRHGISQLFVVEKNNRGGERLLGMVSEKELGQLESPNSAEKAA